MGRCALSIAFVENSVDIVSWSFSMLSLAICGSVARLDFDLGFFLDDKV